jgi:hypothetical protein
LKTFEKNTVEHGHTEMFKRQRRAACVLRRLRAAPRAGRP